MYEIYLICLLPHFTFAWGQSTQSPRHEAILCTKISFDQTEGSMPQVLQRLHKSQRLNFVVSGSPKHKTAKIKAVQSVEAALDSVAAAFGYQWAIDKRGVILFTKKFEANDDPPQIHLAEVRQMTANTLTVLRNVAQSDRSWIDEVQKLAGTITPAQWLLLKSGQSLPAQTLNVLQWGHIQQAGLANQVSDEKRRWQLLSELLSQLADTTVRVRPLSHEGMDEGVMPYRLLLFGKNSGTRPLYEFEMTQPTNLKHRSDLQVADMFRLQDETISEETRGRENSEGVRGRWSKLVTLSHEQISLNELLAKLSLPDELEYSTDNGLNTRLVQVYCVNVSKRAITDALAELEDWHWLESKPGKVRFTRRVLKDIGGVEAIPRRIQATLPRDLRDYLGARRPSHTTGESQPAFVFDVRQRKSAHFDQRKIQLRDYGLRGLIRKLTDGNVGEQGLSFVKMNAEERRLLVTSLLGETLSSMQYRLYGGDFPAYISNPQSAEITLSGENIQILVTHRTAERETSTGFGAPIPKKIYTDIFRAYGNP